MSHKVDLKISFSSYYPMELIKAICRSLNPFNQKLPSLVGYGNEEYTDTQDWVDKLIPKFEYGVMAYWGERLNHEGFISYNCEEKTVKLKISDYKLTDVESLVKMLAPLPWTLATFSDIHIESDWKEYIGPSFSAFHWECGWACAFKEEGHFHVLSYSPDYRSLKFGPWRLIRDEANDISFVQFHDLNADPATALEQAKLGHRAIDVYNLETYTGENYPFHTDLKGIYIPETRNLRVVIPAGQEVTKTFITDYCVANCYQDFDYGIVHTISFVFMDEAEAQNYLHDLWLREIECFGITPQGVEVRLDEGYNPTPNKPDWVRRLEESEGS